MLGFCIFFYAFILHIHFSTLFEWHVSSSFLFKNKMHACTFTDEIYTSCVHYYSHTLGWVCCQGVWKAKKEPNMLPTSRVNKIRIGWQNALGNKYALRNVLILGLLEAFRGEQCNFFGVRSWCGIENKKPARNLNSRSFQSLVPDFKVFFYS